MVFWWSADLEHVQEHQESNMTSRIPKMQHTATWWHSRFPGLATVEREPQAFLKRVLQTGSAMFS